MVLVGISAAVKSSWIVLLPLPAYAPELNPMENVWDYLRANGECQGSRRLNSVMISPIDDAAVLAV